MTSTAGIDLMQGRPTPAIGTTEAKLQQRKLDALRRGVHRIADTSTLPYGVHIIGIGGAGTHVVEQVLRDAPDDLLSTTGSRITALAIDIDNSNNASDATLKNITNLAQRFPADRAQIEAVSLSMPSVAELQDSLGRYRDFLKLEYPLYHWNPDYQPWLDTDQVLPTAGERIPRAIAKAVYGRAYYDGNRPLAAALRGFAKSVEATQGDVVVCIVFGLAGGTGSGIALDLARHLSNGIFGRRVLVTGIGIAPCDGDLSDHVSTNLYPVLNELDCLCDEAKNRGVVLSCGDLYKNPFTAGFLMVPQEPVWLGMQNLAATQQRVNEELAALLTLRRGANLWEMLRLLNWVAAPSTQHSAARTPWGAQWMHLFGFIDLSDQPLAASPELPKQLGLLPGYTPEFIELRVAHATDASTQTLATKLQSLFLPEVTPSVAEGGREGSAQFTLPRVAKTNLSWFFEAREAYESAAPQAQLLDHALLLEQGILLCEPSTRIEGMAGAGIGASRNWVAVPMVDLRGEPVTAEAA
ncbi:MAG: tubulin-like doman-containing protein [Burkholderiales bacterium]